MKRRKIIREAIQLSLAAGLFLAAAFGLSACGAAVKNDAPPAQETNAAGEKEEDAGQMDPGQPGAGEHAESGAKESGAKESGAKESGAKQGDPELIRRAQEHLEKITAAIERQYPEESFSEIPAGELDLSSCIFADSYCFSGRRAASGWEYVAGVLKTRENPLEGMTCGTGGGLAGYTTSQFDDGKLLILEKDNGKESRLTYLYDVLQHGKAGLRILSGAAGRGASLVPPATGPFLKVSMIKEGFPVTEFLPLSAEDVKRQRNGVPVELEDHPEAAGIGLFEDRSQLSALAERDSLVTEEMMALAEKSCGFLTGDNSQLNQLSKAEMKADLYGEVRRETMENRDDLERLSQLLQKASYGEPEFAGNYEGILSLTRQDGTQITVQLAADGSGFVLGNASYYQLSGEDGAAVWSLFSTVDGWRRFGEQIRIEMTQSAYPMEAEKLTFTLLNETGKPIQYILSPIFYKEQSAEDEDGHPVWKRIDSIAGFCGFLSPMDGRELALEVPWNGSFVPDGPGTYKLEIQVMPEADLRYEISDTFELKR